MENSRDKDKEISDQESYMMYKIMANLSQVNHSNLIQTIIIINPYNNHNRWIQMNIKDKNIKDNIQIWIITHVYGFLLKIEWISYQN